VQIRRKAIAGTRYSVGGVPSWPRLGLPRNCDALAVAYERLAYAGAVQTHEQRLLARQARLALCAGRAT
jgi:hypothetical protein